MWRRRSLSGLTLLVLLWSARDAAAVILFLTDQPDPIRGLLIRETDQAVVVRVFRNGGTEELSVPRASIQDMIRSVSAERLEALDPANPDAYREYAEELAEKRKDPDAQWTSLRLFHIAAFLDPDRLGRGCVLSMIPLARSNAERRRLQAMAYLLDPAHDPGLLRSTDPTSESPPRSLTREQADLLLMPLRSLRQGKRSELISAQARRSRLSERLPLLTDTISYQEFEQACSPVCPHCERGRQTCRECQGKRFRTADDGTRVACAACGGRGEQTCIECGGDYKNHRLSPSLLKRIVQLELDWLPVEGEADGDSKERSRTSWAQSARLGQWDPVAPLSLETLTEFDPRRTRYREGNWVE